jgi:hypothetical protein
MFAQRTLRALDLVPAFNQAKQNPGILDGLIREAMLYADAPDENVTLQTESFWSILWNTHDVAGLDKAALNFQAFLESLQLNTEEALHDWFANNLDMSSLDFLDGSGVLVASSNTIGPSPDPCEERIRRMKEIVLIISKKYKELLQDKFLLQHGHRTVNKIIHFPDGQKVDVGSVEGHQKTYRERLSGLTKQIRAWTDHDRCENKGYKMPKYILNWAKRPVPEPIPKPLPTPDNRLPDWVQQLGVTLVVQTSIITGPVLILNTPAVIQAYGSVAVGLLEIFAASIGATLKWQN